MPATPTTFKPDYSDVVVQLMGETQDEYAALKTLHGNFGKWEHLRKRVLARLIMKYRASKKFPEGATGWTDKLLDAAAHNDPEYVAFLEDGVRQANRYHMLDDARARQAQAASVHDHNPFR